MLDDIGALTKTHSFQTPDELTYGTGSIDRLESFLNKQNIHNALIVTDQQLEDIGTLDPLHEVITATDVSSDRYGGVTAEPKLEIVQEIVGKLQRNPYDVVIGVGGGSCMDAAKIAAVVVDHPVSVKDVLGINNVPGSGLPSVLIPTTAGTGSEVTNAAVVTDTEDRNLKKPVYSDNLFADLAIVDPQFTKTLPTQIAVETGLDALTHAIESYVSRLQSPVTDLLSRRAIELIGQSITEIGKNDSQTARARMSLAATLAGMSFCNSSVGAVHALTYPVGVEGGIGHGRSNAILLPYVMEYNVPAAPDRYAEIARLLGKTQRQEESTEEFAYRSVEAVFNFNVELGLPTSLNELENINKHEFDVYADISIEIGGYNLERNPREINRQDVIELFERAYHGFDQYS